MDKVSGYGLVNAKLRARIGLMHDYLIIDEMIKAPTLAESIGVLSKTRHAPLVDIYTKTGDLQQVELYLFSEEVENYKSVKSMMPKSSAKFIDALLGKLEIENLKTALRLWYSEAVRHHSIRYRAVYLYKEEIVYPINWDGIINAEKFDDVKNAIKDTPYYEIINEFSYEDIASSGLFNLEIALDQQYFRVLFKAIDKLSREDRMVAKNLYLVDMDLKNILLLIRYGYYHQLTSDEMERIVIPYGSIYDCLKDDKRSKDGNPILSVRRVIARNYPNILKEVDEIRHDDDFTSRSENAKQILRIENYLGEVRKKEYKQMLGTNVFTIGVALAYFFLSSHEDALIRAILSAKFYNWSEERIREAIVL